MGIPDFLTGLRNFLTADIHEQLQMWSELGFWLALGIVGLGAYAIEIGRAPFREEEIIGWRWKLTAAIVLALFVLVCIIWYRAYNHLSILGAYPHL